MNIMLSSKTVELTEQVKQFFREKLARLQKFPSLGVRNVEVVVDRVKRKGRNTSDATVEVITEVKGRRIAFKEIGANLYQAFFRVYSKVEEKFRREDGERKRR